MNVTRAVSTVAGFLTGQGLVQLLQALSGFVLVRSMGITDYGVAAFFIAVQGSASVLSDLGLRDSIIAVSGQRGTPPDRIGGILAAAMRQRLWNCLPVVVGIVAAFALFHFRQGLALPTALLLAALSVLTVFLNGWNVYYPLPWMLTHDMKVYYAPQIVAQGARLVLMLICVFFNVLDVVMLAILMTLVSCGTAFWFRNKVRTKIEIPQKPSRDDLGAIRRYILPLSPQIIFFAFQDQIIFFILTISGKTENLAELFALGRLSIIMQLFAAGVTVLAMPWIARSPADKLAVRFGAVIGLAVLLAGLTVLGAVLIPDVYLWILGGQYRGLYTELALAMGGAATTFLSAVLYFLNNSRNWVWPLSGVMQVIVVIAIQVVCIFYLDMSQTRSALLLTLLVGVGAMFLQGIYAIFGFATKRSRLIVTDEKVRG